MAHSAQKPCPGLHQGPGREHYSANKQALKDAVREMELKVKEIEAGYTRLMTIDQADVDKYDEEISDLGKGINVILKEVRESLHNAEPRILAQPPEEGPEPRPGGPLLNREHLRPDPLSRDCTPVVFQNWTEEFRLYYSASGCLLYTSPSPRDS